MRKKLGTLLIVGSLGALCAGLAACSNDTMIDGYFKDGNVISVTYDASGGNIAGGDNVTIVDMFNPDKYKADENGTVKIKLLSPTDEKRPTVGVSHIKVSRNGYSLVGWYQTRNLVKDGDDVLDEEGNKLIERDGSYYRQTLDKDGKTVETKTVPAYTYSDPWDFAQDRLEFNKNEQERLDVTLYAAWVKYFTFEYYYQTGGEWTQFGTTSFNCMTAKEDDKKVYVPVWSDGADGTGKMEHAHGSYRFPSLNNMTFKAAYSDPECTQEITRENPLVHNGTIDFGTATADENRDRKVYVTFYEGNYYRVSTAKQFADIADLSGHYTILSETLDFETDKVKWPASFASSEFKGTIGREDEKTVTVKGAIAQYSKTTAPLDGLFGGLFGKIGADAQIENVTFENAVLEIKTATSNRGGSFGLFAGEIDEKAAVRNVKIGGELRLTDMRVSGGFNFNLTANGNTGGVENTGIKIRVCGDKVDYGTYKGRYEYFINPDSEEPTVDESGNITITPLDPSTENEIRKLRMRDKEYYIVYGGEENE